MSEIQGRIASLEISTDGGSTYNEIPCLRDITLNLEKSEIGATCRDDGEWEAYLQGRKAATIDANSLWNEADQYLMDVVDAYYNDTIYHYRWRFQTGTDYKQYVAQALVMSLTKNAPNDDVASVDFSLRVTGAVTPSNQT